MRRLFFAGKKTSSDDILKTMAQVIFFVFVAALALFAIISIIVLFHFLHYRLHKDKHRMMILAFFIGSFAFFLLELSMLANADWDAISEIMRSYLFERPL